MSDYEEKLTPIDEMHSFWSQYRGDAIGRAIHYISKICNLNTAEQAIFHGDGKVTQGQETPFATIDWSDGYPHFTFVSETYNKCQEQLLNAERRTV